MVKSQLFLRKRQKYENFDKNHDFSKNFDFCDFWFSCIFRDPYLCLINDSLWLGGKKVQKFGLFGHFSENLEIWPPQPGQKSMKEWFNQESH